MWRLTLGCGVLFPLSPDRIVMCWPLGPARNLNDLTVASSKYDILLCSETLVSDMHHVLESLVPGLGHPVLCWGRMPWAREKAAYLGDRYLAFHQPKFQCDCCEMFFFGGLCCETELYVFSLYCNSDLDDWNFDCLLTSMATVQAEDVHASFLFVGDFNGHHQEWLGSTTTNRHGVAVFAFAAVSGCDQLIVGPTHAHGGTLDLLMTDVPDLVQVAVVAPIGNSDHSSLSVVISIAQLFQTYVLVGKFSLNIKSIEIQFVVQYRICPGVTFGLLTILLMF